MAEKKPRLIMSHGGRMRGGWMGGGRMRNLPRIRKQGRAEWEAKCASKQSYRGGRSKDEQNGKESVHRS
jgi:hypothetical protein